MKPSRLALAQDAGTFPALSGNVVFCGSVDPNRISGLQFEDAICVSQSFVTSALCKGAGFATDQNFPDDADTVVVFVPRAKRDALSLIAEAVRVAEGKGGLVVLDGQKTDGIDSLVKAVSKAGVPVATFSKAHGKTAVFEANEAGALKEWKADAGEVDGGWITAPGVFSADGVDKASALLIETLPDTLKGTLADLGAGWGYLSASVLRQNDKIEAIHLVEDNAVALSCAQQNVASDKATYHWSDATSWEPAQKMDAVIMNPPFHAGRAADVDLGVQFVLAAFRVLKPGGVLWMVANTHLPYETALGRHFVRVTEEKRVGGFKVISAQKPRRTS